MRAAAQEVIAIAYRRHMLNSVCALAGAGLTLSGILGFATHNWVVTGSAFAVVVTAIAVISEAATSRIVRITGLSRDAQWALWGRYRGQPSFAVRVNVALANDGLSRSLDELTRKLNAVGCETGVWNTLDLD